MNYPLNLQKNLKLKYIILIKLTITALIIIKITLIGIYLEFSSNKSVEEDYNCLIFHLNVARDKYIPYKIFNDNTNTKQKTLHHLRKTIIKKRKCILALSKKRCK